MTIPVFGRGGRHDPPVRKEEVFGPYERYLASTLWPSIRNGLQDLEVKDVREMVPQYATGALHKLVRWARYEPAGEVAMVDDVDQREEFVRMSVLGRHLQARSIGLSEEGMHALFGEAGHGPGAEDRDVVASIVVAMGDAYQGWDLGERIKLAFTIYRDLEQHFVIRKREP